MIVSRYFVLFIVFSVMGWIYETTYCMIRTKTWENRGFLFGPVCPIYGVGAVSITALTDLYHYLWPNSNYTWWQVFIVAYVGSVVLEYVTSWYLEMKFHAFWWDYSSMPLNINGRVCVPYSIGFGFAGILVVYFISPKTCYYVDKLPPLAMEFVGLLLMAVVMIDLTLTVSELTHFERMIIAMDESIDKHMDSFVENVNEKKLTGVIADGGRVAAEKISEKLSSEREKFSMERMEQAVKTMGVETRLAVSRIKGFKTPRIRIGKRLMPNIKVMERARNEMKKYHSKLQNVGNMMNDKND